MSGTFTYHLKKENDEVRKHGHVSRKKNVIEVERVSCQRKVKGRCDLEGAEITLHLTGNIRSSGIEIYREGNVLALCNGSIVLSTKMNLMLAGVSRGLQRPTPKVPAQSVML